MSAMQSIIHWILTECARQRKSLFLWIPVFLGIGIIAYFKGDLSLDWMSWSVGLTLAVIGLWRCRNRYARNAGICWLTLFLICTAITLVITGYGLAKFRDNRVDTRILTRDLPVATVTADIESITPLAKGQGKAKRVVLGNLRFEDPRHQQWNGIRVRLQSYHFKGNSWAVGDRIRVRAKLRAPSPPVIPDGFDFRFKAYFEGLNAVGYTLADAVIVTKARSVTVIDGVARIRQMIAAQIADSMTTQANTGIAIALLTGERAGIDEKDVEALRISGLAHLLAISGLHIGLVAGCVFFFVRLGFALIPGFALHYPIKKYAAAIAIMIAFAYMILAGATVPTIRAFIMTSLVLLAVILDRSALNMRLVALAAMIVMIMTPEAVMGPSFVLSFSAVAALIAFYQGAGRQIFATAKAYHPAWRPVYYLAGVVVTTVIATLATAPFSIMFFNRLGVYSVLSNILAMPVMSFVVMPFGLLSTLLIPLHLDTWLWPVMEWGIAKIVTIAHAITAYPQSGLHHAGFSAVGTAILSSGFLFLILWQGRLRWIGLIAMIGVFVLGATTPAKTQIMITEDAAGIAIVSENADKPYQIGRINQYTRKTWAAHLGLSPDTDFMPIDAIPPATGYCDDFSCRLTIGDHVVGILRNPLAKPALCRDADILIAAIPVDDGDCPHPADIIDRFSVWRNGVTVIRFEERGQYRIETSKTGTQ